MLKTKGQLRLAQLIASRHPSIDPRNESEETLLPLIESMRTNGLLKPIKVVETDFPDIYEVAVGYRRFRAAQLLNWVNISVEIHDSWPELTQHIMTVPEPFEPGSIFGGETARKAAEDRVKAKRAERKGNAGISPVKPPPRKKRD